MKIGQTTIRDRRGAAKRIIDEVRERGTLPRFANWRTVQKLKDAGAICFYDGKYRLGPRPTERQAGYYWVRSSESWEIAEWDGTAWYVINGQRAFATGDFDEISERVQRASPPFCHGTKENHNEP